MCSLGSKDTSGLPRLAPNATWIKKLDRNFWKLFLVNPNHYKCKRLFRNKSSMMAERRRHAESSYFFVIHPLSTLNSILQVLFFIAWMYALMCESLMMMDFNGDLIDFEVVHYMTIIPCRMILVALIFNIGYIDMTTKHIVIESKKIICRYLRTYFFFDLLTSYWLFLAVQLLIIGGVLKGTRLFLFRCEEGAEVLCLTASYVRIYTLLDFMEDTLNSLRCRKIVKFVTINILKTFLYLHIFSCLVFFVPFLTYANEFPPDSWLYRAGLNKFPSLWQIYFECFIVTSCYFFGIAERYSVTLISEEICMIIISFFGRLYTLFLLADVLNTLGIAGLSESKYERQLSLLQQYMAAKDLPISLRQRMVKYFEYKFQGRFFKETEIVNGLSESLRTELFLFSANKLIRKVEIFKKLPKATLGAIIAMMKSEIYSPKDIIVKHGSEIDELYFISSGTVAVMNKKGIEICHLEDGEEFGTSSLILAQQMFAVVAVETTEVFFINKSQFIKLLQPHSEVMIEFYRIITEKLNKYKDMEERATSGKIDLISELQRGNILEKFTKRPRARAD